MTLIPQLFIAILIWIIILGSILSPELKTYSAQLIALLLLFYIILMHLTRRWKKQEQKHLNSDEDTLLFLATYVKPKLKSVIELTFKEENREIFEKQLSLIEAEIETYLCEKEKEVSN